MMITMMPVKKQNMSSASIDSPGSTGFAPNAPLSGGLCAGSAGPLRAAHIFTRLGALATITSLLGCYPQNQATEAIPESKTVPRAEDIPRTPGFSLPEEETLAYRGCSKDEDCVYVTNGCCPCISMRADLAVQ